MRKDEVEYSDSSLLGTDSPVTERTNERIEERKTSPSSYSPPVAFSNICIHTNVCMYVTQLKIRKVSNNGSHLNGIEEEK